MKFFYSILAVLICWSSLLEESHASSFRRKAVLTVQDTIYTDIDAEIILWIWNLNAPISVKLTTSWRANLGLSPSISSLPDDAKSFLFIATTWQEAKRLNLFVSSKKDVDTKLDIADDITSLNLLKSEQKKYWQSLSQERKIKYIDPVLRAIAFEKMRGGFEKNATLSKSAWYWHDGK